MSVLDVLVFKNIAEGTSQHVKRTFGARVLILVFVDRSIARSLDRSIARSIARSLNRSLDRSLARSLDRSLARSLA